MSTLVDGRGQDWTKGEEGTRWPLSIHSQKYGNALVVKTGPGKLYGFSVYNSGAAQFILVMDAAAVPAEGSIPCVVFAVGATSNLDVFYGVTGRAFDTGIVLVNSSTGPTKTIGGADCFFDVQFLQAVPIVNGNGGSRTLNWCTVNVQPPANLTTASSSYTFLQADLSILAQSGTDFSVGSYRSSGAIISAAGGSFQCGWYIGTFFDATLDGGSAIQRFVEAYAQIGDILHPLAPLGLDICVPILVVPAQNAIGAALYASVPGVVVAGGPAAWGLNVQLCNPVGTDDVSMSSIGEFAVWSIT